MMAENDIRYTLSAEFDRKSARELKKLKALTRDVLRDARKETEKLTTVNQRLRSELGKIGQAREITNIAARAREAVKEGRELDSVLKSVEADLKKIGATSDSQLRSVARQLTATQQAARAEPGGGGGRGGKRGGLQGLQRAGREIKALPALQIPGTGISTDVFGNVLRGVSGLTDSFTKLAAGGAITAVAVVAVTLAVKKFSAGLAEAQTRLRAALEAQKVYFDSLASDTTSEATARVEQLNTAQESLSNQIAENATQLANAESQISNLNLGEKFLVKAGDIFTDLPTDILEGRLKELRTEFDANEQALTRLSQGLEAGAFITNDLAEATAKLNREAGERAGRLQSVADQAFIDVSTQTVAVTKARIIAIREERDAIAALAQTKDRGGITQLTGELKNKFDDLGIELVALSENIDRAKAATIDMSAAEKAAADARAQSESQIAFILERRDKILSSLIAQETAASQSIQKLTARIGEVREAALSAEQAALSAFAEAETRLLFEAGERRKEIIAEGAEKQEDLVKQSEKRKLQILRRSNAILFSALGERDALAFLLQKRSEAEALAEEESSFADREDALEKSEAKQLKTLQKSLDRQLQTAATARDRAIKIATDRARKEVTILERQRNEQIAIFESARLKITGITRLSASQTVAATFGMWKAVNTTVSQSVSFVSQQLAQLRALLTPTSTAAPPPLPTTPTLPAAFARGGDFRAGQSILVGERGPELLMPRRSGTVVSNADLRSGNAGGGGKVEIEVSLKDKMLDAKIIRVSDENLRVQLKMATQGAR